MIIEIKDIPNEQLIDKIDIHIDFQKNTLKIETNPKSDNVKPVLLCDSMNREKGSIPDEMLNADF